MESFLRKPLPETISELEAQMAVIAAIWKSNDGVVMPAGTLTT